MVKPWADFVAIIANQTIKNGHNPKEVPVVIDYQCFHSGETRLAPTRDILLLYNAIYLHHTIFSSET